MRIIEFNNTRNQSDTYSKKFFIKLTQRLKLLMKQPLSGIKTNSDEDLLLIWDNYYIFYIYDGSIIEISSIYHQKENVTR
ncbi:hypothetical protein [Mucilaginibacter sp. UR6-11]|uniref:hypothetical protein n=1 Tax=Mucilaginibacter sp. UR6-11 TaxID=1435644 RepID=UPI00351DA689